MKKVVRYLNYHAVIQGQTYSGFKNYIPYGPCAADSKAHGTHHINKFMRGIYAGGTFLSSPEARVLSDSLYEFINSYAWLASKSFERGVPAWPMYPKLHAVHEISHELRRASFSAPYSLNPAVHSCSMDEDFVGKCAMISRGVSPRAIQRRTLQRYLCYIRLLWARD